MNAEPPASPALSLAQIREARRLIDDRILTTPVQPLSGPAVEAAFAPGTRSLLNLELFQRTGSFEQNVRDALQISHRGYILETGAVVMQGPCTELLKDKITKAYLGA